MNLTDLEHLLAVSKGHGISYEDAGTILQAALHRLRQAHAEAAAATQDPHRDVRPALCRLLRTFAAVHGRTPAEQVAAFAAEGDQVFLTLALRGWGLAFDLEAE